MFFQWLNAQRCKGFVKKSGSWRCALGRRWAARPRLEMLEDRTLLSASLVRDINLDTASSSPMNLTDVNGLLYFSATDNAGNIALYTSDGTASHTVRVKEFVPAHGNPSAGLFNLTNINGTVFFDVSDPSNGRSELWQSNGTAAGTRLVRSFQGDSFVNSNASFNGGATFVSFNKNLYFIVQQPSFSNNIQLWTSDGATTTQIGAGEFSVENAPQFTVANNTLFFAAGDPATGNHAKLWKIDGTGGSPQVADADVSATGVNGLTNVNGTLCFFAESDPTLQTTNLYQSDGTHTTLIQAGFGNFFGEETAVVNGKLFFSASPPTGGFAVPELWVFDPASQANPPQNPRMLQPAHASASGLDPFNLTSVNGLLLFNGFDDSGNTEPVWVSDGTDADTNVLFPNTAAFALLFPENVAVANNKLFFGAQGPGPGEQLWQTDGSVAGTTMIADLGHVPFVGGPSFGLTFSHGKLFFAGTDLTHGAELWKSDGTAAGTRLVKDIDTDTDSSNPSQLVNADGELYFTADDGLHPGLGFGSPPEIWKSNGTTDDTDLVSTPFPTGGPSGGDFPGPLVNVHRKVFFTAVNDPQLWVTDGTARGTTLVMDFSASDPFATLDNLTAVGNNLLFTVLSDTGDQQLWKSDGTAAGTVLVADNVSVESQSGVVAHGLYFFISFDPITFDQQLWESDGTAAGTHVVDPTNPGINVQGLTNVKGTLFYFDNNANSTDATLWKTDGATATLVAHIHPGDLAFSYDATAVKQTLNFAVTDNTTGVAELWTSDGTPGGTGPVATVQPDFGKLAAVGDRLFFTVDDPINGEQLWVSDGAGANTHMVAPIVAGTDNLGNPLPLDLTAYNGKLFFAASDPTHGEELWESNGTTAGTFMVQDINHGPAGAGVSQLTVVDGTLFFTADDGTHGTELWAYRPGNDCGEERDSRSPDSALDQMFAFSSRQAPGTFLFSVNGPAALATPSVQQPGPFSEQTVFDSSTADSATASVPERLSGQGTAPSAGASDSALGFSDPWGSDPLSGFGISTKFRTLTPAPGKR